MNKLIYYETQIDKNKDNILELNKLRAEILSDMVNNISFLDKQYLKNLLERVNKIINFLVDKV